MTDDVHIDSRPACSDSATERRKLFRDAVANNLAAPVSALVGLVLVPVMLRGLGAEYYGLWIVALSLSGMASAVDFGLGWSVSRLVAADPKAADSGTVGFVRSASSCYLLVGIAGWLCLGGAGLLCADSLRLPPVDRSTAGTVFWLVGAAFCADRVATFGSSVLTGLRRFEVLSLISSLSSVVWAAAVLLLFAFSGDVTALAAANLAVTLVRCLWSLRVVARINPGFCFRPGPLRWESLRGHALFAVSSMFVDLLYSVGWNIAPVLVGFIGGPASVVPFYLGQKFVTAVSAMSNRASEVLFPAASLNRHDPVRSREILQAGLRWILVLTLPIAALLWAGAPQLLNAWVGEPPPGAPEVLRILSAAVLAEAFSTVPLHFLWGRGTTRPILWTYLGQALGVAALTAVLCYPLGIAGAAWGMLVPIALGAGVLVIAAARECGLDPGQLIREVTRGLVLPVILAGSATLLSLRLGGYSRAGVVAGLALAGTSYLATLFFITGNEEEKRVGIRMLSMAGSAAGRLFGAVRGLLSRSYLLRSAWRFCVTLSEYLRDPWRNPSYFERYFAVADPWQYETGENRQRLVLAASMLAGLREGKFSRALEIGCAEGIFTERLAGCCSELVAVDFAPTALARARSRLPQEEIRFQQFDLRHDPLPGVFDLIVAMDVLDTVFRPAILGQIRSRLVDALEPGGYLLLVDPRQNPMFETEWWGKCFLRGGKNVRDFMARHPALRLVREECTPSHVFGLFLKEKQ